MLLKTIHFETKKHEEAATIGFYKTAYRIQIPTYLIILAYYKSIYLIIIAYCLLPIAYCLLNPGQDDGEMGRMMARMIAQRQDDGQDDGHCISCLAG